jgi:hypothetical protein
MNWESSIGKNRTASWIVQRLASNSRKKALSAKERRTLYEFREKGNEILYRWCLNFPGVDIPLITFLDNLISNPLTKLLPKPPDTPADMDQFISYVAENPLLLRALVLSELTDIPVFIDENPYGYDPDGMKQQLYEDRPDYHAILDDLMDDYGYDECEAALDSYGLSTYTDEFYEDDDREMYGELDPAEIQHHPERIRATIDELRARMIVLLKHQRARLDQ